MSKKIIIACDNEHICDFIENYAEKEGFTVRTICDISEDTQHVVRECLVLHPDIEDVDHVAVLDGRRDARLAQKALVSLA